jgi:prefoldin subunit 5
MEEWYRIELSYATFAIVFKNGKVIKTAPIAKYMIEKSFEFAMAHYKNKRAKIEKLKDQEEDIL